VASLLLARLPSRYCAISGCLRGQRTTSLDASISAHDPKRHCQESPLSRLEPMQQALNLRSSRTPIAHGDRSLRARKFRSLDDLAPAHHLGVDKVLQFFWRRT
jgi:hypothetical protein